MSFILDALKKSENERQRQIGPSLADIAPRAKRQGERPWWAVLVGVLLLVNLSVLIIVLARDDSDAQPALGGSATAPVVDAPRAQNPAVAPAQTRLSPPAPASGQAARSLADEANGVGPDEADASRLAGAAVVPEGPPIVRQIEPPAVAPLPAHPAAQPSEESLPTMQDLAVGGTTLPELHLDIHVYDSNPTKRFVFVNMRKYLEGETLSEGPSVERITT